MEFVPGFAEQAQSLMDAALAALERGESGADMTVMTVLIGRDGGIQMCADSDWPLDSLMLDRGARTGYRVSSCRGSVRVEGREGLRRCVLEGSTPARGLTWLRSNSPLGIGLLTRGQAPARHAP